MNAKECDNLLAVLQQKKQWLDKMLAVTQQLMGYIEADRIDEFAAGLKNREQIISKIDAFARMERQFADQSNAETDAIKTQTQAVIHQILQLDAQNAKLAGEKIALYKQQIKSINESKKGVDNYARPYPSDDAFYIDTKE